MQTLQGKKHYFLKIPVIPCSGRYFRSNSAILRQMDIKNGQIRLNQKKNVILPLRELNLKTVLS